MANFRLITNKSKLDELIANPNYPEQLKRLFIALKALENRNAEIYIKPELKLIKVSDNSADKDKVSGE